MLTSYQGIVPHILGKDISDETSLVERQPFQNRGLPNPEPDCHRELGALRIEYCQVSPDFSKEPKSPEFYLAAAVPEMLRRLTMAGILL